MKFLFQILILSTGFFFTNYFTTMAQNKTTIQGEEISYTANGLMMRGYVAYDKAIAGKRPAIIVVPEWWGCNAYTHLRARMLAELGYIAIAVDMYGDGRIANNPTEAQEFATPFYKDAQLAKSRIEAAVNKLKEYPETDASKMAAIGYCFGGSMVLNMAKLGMDFKGVVSFHGGLQGVPAVEGKTKAKILVCHGAADKFVSEDDVINFKRNLDDTKTAYTFKVYENATHAFSNPEATANGIKFNMPIAYNEAADKQSWLDMVEFFKNIL
jgi:dienelactone hydrolase